MSRIVFKIIIVCFILLNQAYAADYNDLLNFNFEEGSVTSKVVRIILGITILGLAPSIIIMVTSFTRITIVLSCLRSAIGLQQSPPNQVLISLALFLTFFIMSSTLEEAYDKGIKPLINETITEEEAIPFIIAPFKKFMIANTRQKDIDLFTEIANAEKVSDANMISMKIVIPSFIISEMRRAFEIGFLIFLPFIIIDMLISSILMAMGMMMMPPVMVSLPFKLIFFVIIDGWYMIAGSLVKSFVT